MSKDLSSAALDVLIHFANIYDLLGDEMNRKSKNALQNLKSSLLSSVINCSSKIGSVVPKMMLYLPFFTFLEEHINKTLILIEKLADESSLEVQIKYYIAGKTSEAQTILYGSKQIIMLHNSSGNCFRIFIL